MVALVAQDHAVLVPKEGIPVPLGLSLKRQGNQVPKAALGQGVLVGKEAVIGLEAELVAAVHGPGQEAAPQLSRPGGGDGLREEKPDVGPLPERERSTAGVGLRAAQVSRRAETSSRQASPSKFAARSQVRSSSSMG